MRESRGKMLRDVEPWLLVCMWCFMFTSGDAVKGLPDQTAPDHDKVPMNIRFIVAVNATWELCTATVTTPFLKSDTTWNDTKPVDLGGCDHGPLTFEVKQGSRDGVSKADVVVTFYSANIAAMPPQCNISWNYSYIDPTTWVADQSPLPGCYTTDSVEGYHMTEFWFWIMEWMYV